MKKELTGKTCRVVLMLALLSLAAWVISDYFPTRTTANQDQYVGSDACKDCHEDQFKNFVPTSHARLSDLASWKNKVTGCEACHGPGKEHAAEGNPAKIISFKNKSSKQISETCLDDLFLKEMIYAGLPSAACSLP